MFTVTLKGIASGTTTVATLTTLKNYAPGIGTDSELWSDTTEMQALLDVAQPMTSATVTSYSYEFGTSTGDYGTPAPAMDSSNLFQEDFSDVTVTPTLSIKLGASDSAYENYVAIATGNPPDSIVEVFTQNNTISLKYVTDPESAGFKTKVNTFIEALRTNNFGKVYDPYDEAPVVSAKVGFTVDEDIEG